MRVLMITTAILAFAGPSVALQSSDNPNYIPGQSRSTLTIYTQAGLSGERYLFTEAAGNITDGLRAASLRTSGGAWEVCDGANFQGQCRVAEGWTFNVNDLGLRRIRSIRPLETEAPQGMIVKG
jgi:hypothetical protein